MRKYRRMTYEDRCHISALLQAKHSIAEISKKCGFHKSSIYRELRRNCSYKIYRADLANRKTQKRYRKCRRKKIITPAIKEELIAYLSFGWSPEQIAGRFKREKHHSLSRQTIYRAFYSHTLGYKLIRKRGRRRSGGRSTQQKIKRRNTISIDQRSKAVDKRFRVGDWERDGMYGANRKQLLIFTDRKSKYTKIRKMGKGYSKDVSRITLDVLLSLGKKVYTLTNDNGSEFNDSASLPFKVYHCHPNKPQQRGTVENTIGLLRHYIKRKTDLDKLTTDQLQDIENRVNFRPRKGLDYKTPFEVFFKQNVALAMDN